MPDIQEQQNKPEKVKSLHMHVARLGRHDLDAGTALTPFEVVPGSSAHSTALGRWVFAHQKDFSPSSPLAWYGIRNVLDNIVAMGVGLMPVIVLARMGMGHAARGLDRHATEMEKAAKGSAKFYRTAQQFMSNAVIQNMLGVGLSFATWRLFYKVGQRAYDRIFMKPHSADEATQALHDAPKNLLSDLSQIAPAEYPATMVAATALVGIRFAITPRGWETKEHILKDTMGCALLAYPAFFEITDRLGESFMSARGYNTKDTNEHLDRHKMGLGEFLTRQLPGVAAGIIPYIGFNNLLYRKTGRQFTYSNSQMERGIKQVDGFVKGYLKEMPYQVFWMFTLGRDLYFDAYDKLTGRDRKAAAAGIPDYVRRAHADSTGEIGTEGTPMGFNAGYGMRPATTINQAVSEGMALPQEMADRAIANG